MAATAEVSTKANTGDNQNLGERTNDSGTSGGDSTAADGTGVSLSASAYEVIQQYSEAELHGEYEEQYFGFTADSVADNLYNAAVHRMWAALSHSRTLVQAKFPGQLSEEQCEFVESKLMGKFQQTIDKAFDKLAIYLKTNIFKVPGNVVLPEDKVQVDYKCTEQEAAAIDIEISELEAAVINVSGRNVQSLFTAGIRRMGKAKYVNACLRQEVKDNADIFQEMERMLQHVSSIEEVFAEAGVTNMKEAFHAMKQQLNELKEIIETLQPIREPLEKKSRLMQR